MRLIILLFFVSIISGCSIQSRVNNVKLDINDEHLDYTQANHKYNDIDDMRVYLSFSGGGTRAAALSYGVMKGLRDTIVSIENKERTLLSEVDVISSVSGGSFTSAYYGLYGDKIFTDYEDDFLKRDVQEVLIRGLFNPINWVKFISSNFDRTDLAIDYYNEAIFKNATFADFRKDGPFIQINATDLNSGESFLFKQEYFNLLCSDLSQVDVARAVTASSAVPVAFAPIVFENYSNCEYEIPDWLSDYFNNTPDNRTQQVAESLKNYLDKDKVKYIHLVDGGIADNLGIRALYDTVNIAGGSEQFLDKMKIKAPKYLVLILVNAAVSPEKAMSKNSDEPSLSEQIDAVTSAQINRYSTESIQLLKENIEEWGKKLSRAENREVKTFFIQVDFESIKNERQSKMFNLVSTSLSLSAEQVDKLRNEGERLLKNSPEFKKLLKEIQ